MPRRVPLDPHLASGAFRIADALAAGMGESRLRSRDLERPHHGVRVRADGAERDATTAARHYAPLLRPGDRFSGPTAAALWGAPLPHDAFPVHVTAGSGLTRVRRPGVVGHAGPDAAAALRRALPVSPPALAFLECAGVLALPDLVAVGDHLVLDPRILDPLDLRPHLTLDELRAFLATARGRHVRLARDAAALVRNGVESRRETLLRLLIHEAGLPEPQCGVLVRDRAGREIGWFDLVWPDRRVIAEYDGDQHRTSTHQYDRDIRRFDRATEAGYRVIRVRARGLGPDRTETVERIRRALTR
ncbi:MAG: hypothetical protein DI534_14635 [Leifsonia xyli]|nr:MAG: hypothetical protein DI534_14635 [Leifsonia xyli]